MSAGCEVVTLGVAGELSEWGSLKGAAAETLRKRREASPVPSGLSALLILSLSNELLSTGSINFLL